MRPAEAADKARVTCSAFAPDEAFAPGTFHLPAGQHTLRVEADGFAPVDKQVTAAGRQPLAVELTLEASASPEPEPAAATAAAAPASAGASAGDLTAVPVARSAGRGPWPYVVLGVAGAALVGGVAMHVKARSTKEDAESSLERYNQLANDYESQRTITYTLYTVAVVSGAIGTWLWFKGAPDDGDGGFHAGAAPTADGGAFVTLGWRR